HAQAHDFVGAPADDIGAADQHATVLMRQSILAGEAFEERALAGAIGSDQTAQLAFLQREVHRVDGDDAAETHSELVCFYHAVHGWSRLTMPRRRRAPP